MGIISRKGIFAVPKYLRRALVVLSAVAWLGVPAPGWAQKGTIKIAVQAPLSGEQAALGAHIKLGAQLAVEDEILRRSLS